MTRVLLLAVAVALSIPMTVQTQAVDSLARGSITGTVHDSVAGLPVAGATVNVVSATNRNSRVLSAISDARGEYLVAGLSPGRYLMNFRHAALDSLALSPPEFLVTVGPGQRVAVPLAVPSAATIRATMCGVRPAEDSTGALLGRVIDARSLQPVTTGAVETRWQQLLFGRGAMALHPRNDRTTIGNGGWYAQCVPGGIEVATLASSGADSSGVIGIVVPPVGVLRRDFVIGGRAILRGFLTSENGAPVANARVGIVGRERESFSDGAGRFTMHDIPAGSQIVEVRALGHVPERRQLELSNGADSTMAIRLTTLKRMLDTITVVGKRVYDRDRSGFLRRSRSGLGFTMDAAAIARLRAVDAFQLLRRAPGVFVDTRALRRALLIRDRMGGYCVPTVFLDGIRMLGPAHEDVDLFVRPEELEGIELYRAPQVPPEYFDLNRCAVLLLWTRPVGALRPPSDQAPLTEG